MIIYKQFNFVLYFLGVGLVFFIFLTQSCADLDYVDNTKYKVSGILKDVDNQILPNYKITIQTQITNNQDDSIYAGNLNDSKIAEIITDSQGKFQVYFPKTNGKEYLFVNENIYFEYKINEVWVHKNFYPLQFTDYQQHITNLIIYNP